MSEELITAIRQAADDVFDEVVAGLRAAVGTPSVNPAVEDGAGEGAVQQVVAAEMTRLGCRVEAWEPDADALVEQFPFLRATVRPSGFAGRPNVVGWLPAGEPADGARAHLILNSHVDTVAPGDAAAWPHPPFSAALAGGKIHGLGSVDAKGCLFTFLGAAAVLRRAGIRLRRSVMIQSVVDEEWGGSGVLDCVRRGYTAAAALVGEPSGLRVCPASRGAMSLHLRIAGRKAHPGEGWRGVNAIRKAWLYVDALDRLRDDLDRTHMHPLWAGLPAGHVWNLMGMTSGMTSEGQARSVPDRCEVLVGIGLIGEERPATMRPVVEAALRTVTEADAWLAEHPPQITWRPGAFDPAVTDPSHPAVAGLAEAAGEVMSAPVAVEAFSAGTDGRHLTNAGGVPSINFGPGELYLGHSPLEALALDDLRRAIEITSLFIARYCGIASMYC